MKKIGFIKYSTEEVAKNCDQCGSVFYSHIHNAKRCSKECKNIYHATFEKARRQLKEKKERIINCVICSNPVFLPKGSKISNICCSEKCKKVSGKKRAERYKNNPDYALKAQQSAKKHRNSEKRKEWLKNNRKNLTQKRNEYFKLKAKTDLKFRLTRIIRATVGRIFKKNRKNINRSSFCSYTPEQLKNHLERKFREGMSWENYGRLGWHIDHIKPLSAFKFFDELGNLDLDELKSAMALENLQPLWYDENIKKGGLRLMRTNNKENNP